MAAVFTKFIREKEREDMPMLYGYGFDWLSILLMSLGTVLWIALLGVLV